MKGYEFVIQSKQIGLVYSPDDNGYYWQELYDDWLVSKVFPTKEEAIKADEEDMQWS